MEIISNLLQSCPTILNTCFSSSVTKWQKKQGMEKRTAFSLASLGLLILQATIPRTLVAHISLAVIVVRLQKGLGNQGWGMGIYLVTNSVFHTLTLGKCKEVVFFFSWLDPEAQIPLLKWYSKI